MNRNQKKTTDKGRREFLQDSAAAGLGLVVTASLPGAAAANSAAEPGAASKENGYRLTSHILEYYKTIAS